MQLTKLKSGKKEPKQYVNQDPFEALLNLPSDIKKSAVNDLGKAAITDAWDQMFGLDSQKRQSNTKSGELTVGQELNLGEIKREVRRVTEQGEDFVREIVHAGKRADSEESREIQVKVAEILIEIKQLAKSAKEVQAQVEVISVEQTTQDKGVYHISFLEQMLGFLRDTRLNVEDSLAWFKSLRSKKAARQYGVLAKKHGAQFMLSNERAAVTQTG